MDKFHDSPRVSEILGKLPEFDYGTPTFLRKIEVTEKPLFTLEDNSTYEGQWIQNKDIIQGKGKQVFPNGSIYEGWFLNSQRTGKGRLIHSDGDVYTGNFLNNKAHGFGVYTNTEGATYEGNW